MNGICCSLFHSSNTLWNSPFCATVNKFFQSPILRRTKIAKGPLKHRHALESTKVRLFTCISYLCFLCFCIKITLYYLVYSNGNFCTFSIKGEILSKFFTNISLFFISSLLQIVKLGSFWYFSDEVIGAAQPDVIGYLCDHLLRVLHRGRYINIHPRHLLIYNVL